MVAELTTLLDMIKSEEEKILDLVKALPDEEYARRKDELISKFAHSSYATFLAGVELPDARFQDLSSWLSQYEEEGDFPLDGDDVFSPQSAYLAGGFWTDKRFLPHKQLILDRLLLVPDLVVRAGKDWQDQKFEALKDALYEEVKEDYTIVEEGESADYWAKLAYQAGCIWSDERFDVLKEDFFFADVVEDSIHLQQAVIDWPEHRKVSLVQYLETQKQEELVYIRSQS